MLPRQMIKKKKKKGMISLARTQFMVLQLFYIQAFNEASGNSTWKAIKE